MDNKIILENSKNLNILYVEDDETLRLATAKLFKNFFKSVEVGLNGLDGLSKYKESYEKNFTYDIVITDISMPKMNGIEMCENIRSLCFEQSIIFITAYNEIKYFHSALELGVDGFITKPIEIKQLKKVLYTTTQKIVDKKLIHSHYKQIEEQNMLNINQIDASSFSSAKDIVLDLIKNKESISHLWVGEKVIDERLKYHSIDVEFFRSHYAIKVVEYFTNVIQGKAELGNCPIIFVMLDFFKNKNLPLEDIFMICVIFKNVITSYIFDKYSFNHEMFDDISMILDANFEGVVINYLKIRNCKKRESVKKIPKVEILQEEIESIEDINYIEYVLDHDVYELQDLEDDIDSLAITVTESKNSSVDECFLLGSKIRRYGEILSNYPLFIALGKYIVKLGVNFSDNSQLLFDDKERMLNITALIEGFVNDLIVWRKEIFENNIQNPHFLDNSFFSNVDTIIMFIEYDESAEVLDDGVDIEFF